MAFFVFPLCGFSLSLFCKYTNLVVLRIRSTLRVARTSIALRYSDQKAAHRHAVPTKLQAQCGTGTVRAGRREGSSVTADRDYKRVNGRSHSVEEQFSTQS